MYGFPLLQAYDRITVKQETPLLFKNRQGLPLFVTGFQLYGFLFLQAYDRITVKQETPLLKTGRAFRNVSTSEDPIIR
jgi:hypothetical protein